MYSGVMTPDDIMTQFFRRFDVLDELVADMREVKADVKAIKADVDTLKGDVGTLKADVGTLKGDVAVLKSEMREVKATLGLHSVALMDLNHDVSEIKAMVRGHGEAIAQLQAVAHSH